MENIVRDSFIFYRGFAEAIKEMDAAETKEFVTAICDYALDGKEPDLSGLMAALFLTVKPQIDINNQRYENGKKGGRKKTKEEPKKTKPEPNETKEEPKKTKPEPNVNVNVNVNDNVNDNVNENVNVSLEVMRDKENKRKKANDLFEYLWSLYPNKKGKGQVSDKSKRKLAEIGSDEMERAIDRYLSELAKDDWRKPQNGSTFFNSGYIDYLDCNFVPSAPIARDGPEGIDIMNIDF